MCICSLRVDIQIPDEESVELIMNGVAVLLQQPPNSKKLMKKVQFHSSLYFDSLFVCLFQL